MWRRETGASAGRSVTSPAASPATQGFRHPSEMEDAARARQERAPAGNVCCIVGPR